MKKLFGLVLASLTVFALFGSAANASVRPALKFGQSVSATTVLSNRDDSGVYGNWAKDHFTRAATIKLVNQVSVSNCPGSDTGKCYLWNFKLADKGTFTTVVGANQPNANVPLDLALTGPMTGGTKDGEFYASWRNPIVSNVPATLNGSGGPRQSTTNWVEQFFGPSAVFNSAANAGGPDLGSSAGWTYTLGFGSNPQCKNEATQWVDAAAGSWGSLPADGNIHANNSAHCSV